jgi:hypothetical protein
MKEKEFDELIRQQFEQNDFEFKPANWAQLNHSLNNKNGGSKKLLWIPLAILGTVTSIAASIAMIVAIPKILQHNTNAKYAAQYTEPNTVYIHTDNNYQNQPEILNNTIAANSIDSKNTSTSGAQQIIQQPNHTALSYQGANFSFSYHKITVANAVNTFKSNASNAAISRDREMQTAREKHMLPFKNGDATWLQKTSVSIASSFSYGNAVSGYSIIASGRKMISNKFYIEGDIAFVSNTATERYGYTPVSNSSKSMYSNSANGGATAGDNYGGSNSQNMYATLSYSNAHTINNNTNNNNTGPYIAARTTSGNSNGYVVPDAGTPNVVSPNFTLPYEHNTPQVQNNLTREDNYNLYYAQVCPTIGFHCNKVLSIGVGGDFQHLILQGHSNITTDNTGAIKEIPGMDMGLVGKTELAVNKKIKAGLSYRQGLNNMIAGSNKYVDRSYIQFQLKYMIFKK